MKLAAQVVVLLIWSTFCWGQNPDVEITRLNRVVEEQSHEIEELKARISQIERALGVSPRTTLQSALYVPATQTAVAPQSVTTPVTTTQPGLAGFRLTGDLRLRLDATFRSATPTTPGTQNVRGRYRARLNVDREISPDLNFRLQLSTGAVNNSVSADQDFAGGGTRAPMFISEAYIDYHPNPDLSIRGGRVENAFADNLGFTWDDDVRFNGINERYRSGRVEFRAGQYFLIHPNTHSVAATSPLATLAGVRPGTIARASQLYHQGVIVSGNINKTTRHQFITDVQLYRNPNLIALSTVQPAGIPVTLNPAIGLTLSGPGPGVGNATQSPGTALLYARHYQIVRAFYRLDTTQLGGNPKLPLTWTAQASRNVGTSQLRDAMLTSLSIGRNTESGDLRGLYGFTIKDANSIISQFTDDNIGTSTGVNIATHFFRVDYTVRSNIQFQNLLFSQTQRRNSNPAASFFVPLGSDAPRGWRYQGQINFSF